MPSQVRIIQARNSPEWDAKVSGWLEQLGYGREETYGGISSQERADEVRRKIRTAAKRLGHSAKVYWHLCDAKPGQCQYDPACTHHVKFSFYDPEVAKQYKAQQAQQRR